MKNLELKENRQGLKNTPVYYFDEVITINNLIKAITDTYKATPWKRGSQLGYSKLIFNAINLLEELRNETYIPKEPIRFTINERGKTRKIESYIFLDKVVQKLLAQNILLKIINRSCIYDTYACLKGRGVSKARNRLASFLVSAKNKYGDFAVAKIDIKSYFESIDTNIMIDLIKDLVDDKILRLFHRLYDNKVFSLGSELNQLFATIYLNRIDHKIKEVYKIKYYVRYQDDFILLDKDLNKLKETVSNIIEDFKRLKLKPNLKKTKVEMFRKVEFLKIQFSFKNNKLTKRKVNSAIRYLIKKLKRVSKLNLDKEYINNYKKSILGQYKDLNNYNYLKAKLNSVL